MTPTPPIPPAPAAPAGLEPPLPPHLHERTNRDAGDAALVRAANAETHTGSSDDRIALVMTTSSPITPAQGATAVFDPNLLYQLKVDNNGDAVEDLVLQVTFEGTGTNQRVVVRGPVRPEMTGTRSTVVNNAAQLSGTFNTSLGSPGSMQVFAGLRDDPFFLDLEQFCRIVPDRRPVSGARSQLPDQPTASSFRPAGQAVDYLR